MAATVQQSELHPGYTVIRIDKRFDTTISDEIEAILKELYTEGKYDIIIDFTESNYLSSMGLRVLFSASRMLGAKDKKLTLVNAGPTVMKVIKIADCASLFNIYASEEEMK